MGTGGTSFRLSLWTGALCVGLAAGCRTSDQADDLRSLLRVEQAAESSLARGHRFGNWLEIEPDPSARSTLEQACLLEQTGGAEEAIGVLTEELANGSECPSAFEARGALYLATGYPRAAAGDFQHAVALAPERARGWFALGHAYETLGLARQALEALEHAQRLGCDDSGLYLSLARVLHSLGRTGLAAHHYQLALERSGDLPREALVEAAVLAYEDPTRAAAVEDLRDRLETCRGTPLSNDAWFLRALLRELPGEPTHEIAAAFQALEIAPLELEALTGVLLTAVQLLDPETEEAARVAWFAGEPDPARRAALERCLAAE